MKKIVIALTALAGITLLSACANYDNYGFSYYPHRYSIAYGNGGRNRYYWREGMSFDCFTSFDAAFCA